MNVKVRQTPSLEIRQDFQAHHYRAPLIWFLLPLIAGYIIGSRLSLPILPLLAVALVLLLIALPFSSAPGEFARTLWYALFSLSIILMAWGYFAYRNRPLPPEWYQLPPREAQLTISVIRTYATSPYRQIASGVAEVTVAPAHLPHLLGKRIFFQLRPTSEHSQIVRTQRHRVRGILSYVSSFEETDPFDEHLIRSGVYLELRRGRFLEEAESETAFYRFCAEQNTRFESILRKGTEGASDLGNIYVAMLLGKKQVLTQDQKEAFLKSGTLHLFAISGLHVGAVFICLNSILGLLRIEERTRAILALGLLFLYAHITGGAPSAIRAFLMISFYWSARIFVRQSSPFAGLLASALGVLLWDPRQLWNAGFQLSYGVVSSILLYGVPLIEALKERMIWFPGLPMEDYRWYHRRIIKYSGKVIELFSISTAATLMSTPLTIHFFGLFTPGALLLNMILVSLAIPLVYSGVISIAFGALGATWISSFFNHGSLVLISIMEKTIQICLKIPGFFLERQFAHPNTGPICLIALLILLLAMRTRPLAQSKKCLFLPPAALLLVILTMTVPAP